jgi:hypothetical protein
VASKTSSLQQWERNRKEGVSLLDAAAIILGIEKSWAGHPYLEICKMLKGKANIAIASSTRTIF